jgi:UDP-N-acetylglucosamine transferase subunit ALG13
MIFITAGTQFPFERLLKYMGEWASINPKVSVVAQAGKTAYFPEGIKIYEYLSPDNYVALVKQASVIVGHAGSGTIITACEHQIPAIIMPRRFDLQEHRSEHQLGMAQKFSKREGVYIAQTKSQLFELLAQYKNLKPVSEDVTQEKEMLVQFLNKQIFSLDKDRISK